MSILGRAKKTPNTAPLRASPRRQSTTCTLKQGYTALKPVPSKRRDLVPGERRDAAQSRPQRTCGAGRQPLARILRNLIHELS